MPIPTFRSTISAGLILASVGWSSACPGAGPRPHPTSLERYGLGGHIQPIGVRHGFHIETVAVDSPAAEDQLKANDIIVKVDGEPVRSLDHLRAVLAEAYAEDGDVTLTYMRGTSLSHHVLMCHLKPQGETAVARRRRPNSEDVAPR